MLQLKLFDWEPHSSLPWNICWFVANGILLGRRAYIAYVEEDMSASQRFALRANSLRYATLWCLFAILTIIFVFLDDEPGDKVNTIGVLLAEFVAVCLWRPYFGNSRLVDFVVQETHERLAFFLVQGLGLNATECAHYWKANEKAIVDLWTQNLKEKKWKDFTPSERNALLFDTGVECGKVLEDSTWDGVLYDVAAFFQEWRAEVESTRPQLRVPDKIARSMMQGNDAGCQALLSIAVLVANEDTQLRKTHDGWDVRRASRQFSAARIAKRKTAAEGILRWPDCIAQEPRMHIQKAAIDIEDLRLISGDHSGPCQQIERLPSSVLYTLTEIIRCGYLRLQPDGKVHANITFKYGNMVFNKDQWNPLRAIQRKPFRYITSATWMAGDVAFVVEQRELTGSSTATNGSGYLSGTLKMQFDVEVEEEDISWVDQSRPPHAENETIWGDVGDIEKPVAIHFLNKPMAWLIDFAWMLSMSIVWLMKLVYKCSTHLFSCFNEDTTSPLESRSRYMSQPSQNSNQTVAEMLVLSDSGRNNGNTVRKAETLALIRQLGVWMSRHNDAEDRNDRGENNV